VERDNNLAKFIREKIKKYLLFVLRKLPLQRLEGLIWVIIAGVAKVLTPVEALRFLFRLDNKIYGLEGAKAVEYGRGIHTKHRHTKYHDFFVKRVQPGEQVLDIGCGNGAVAYDVAKETGAEVTGIDLNAENIAQARKLYQHPKLHFRVGNALYDLPKKHFDVVILSNILEHLEKRPSFLHQIQEIVRPSRFLIRVPLFERDWRVPLKEELGVDYRLDPTHCTEYTLEGFIKEMKEAGLKVVDQEIRWGEIWVEVRPNESS
jgi:2-polyprenyl-3-methyl-5-hydroxy-6-metoxy-1,4-benzoquinol methylase